MCHQKFWKASPPLARYIQIITFCIIVVKSPKIWLPINQQQRIVYNIFLRFTSSCPPSRPSPPAGGSLCLLALTSGHQHSWNITSMTNFNWPWPMKTTGTSFLSRLFAFKQIKLPCWLQHQGSWAQLETQRGRLPPRSQVRHVHGHMLKNGWMKLAIP